MMDIYFKMIGSAVSLLALVCLVIYGIWGVVILITKLLNYKKLLMDSKDIELVRNEMAMLTDLTKDIPGCRILMKEVLACVEFGEEIITDDDYLEFQINEDIRKNFIISE